MGKLPDYMRCDLCARPDAFAADSPQALVPSSERAFVSESFTLWQCRGCGCIHARDGVDLDHYYSRYELHDKGLDAITRFFYRRKLRFLERAGLQRRHTLLDYGCGSGAFLQYLQEQGYRQCSGYDPFTKEFASREVLDKRYDVVMSSDVIEHDITPREHLRILTSLANDDGLVYVQTPNAEHIDLSQARKHRQVFQQPFHRHILSRSWMCEELAGLGWRVRRELASPYFHSHLPFLNLRFLDYYCDRYDGLVAMNEPFHWAVLAMPRFWLLGLFGGLWPLHDEMQIVFAKGGKP